MSNLGKPDSRKPSDIIVNKEAWKSFTKELSVRDVMKEAEIGYETYVKLERGKPVEERTVRKLATCDASSIRRWINLPAEFRIPDDDGILHSLELGYFIDHERHGSGHARWFR